MPNKRAIIKILEILEYTRYSLIIVMMCHNNTVDIVKHLTVFAAYLHMLENYFCCIAIMCYIF